MTANLSSPPHPFTRSPAQTALAVGICTLLVIVFTVTAWRAVLGKSATFDEPNHTAVGWLNLWRQDFRLSPDVPPLWEDWIAVGIGKDAFGFDPASPSYRQIETRRQTEEWCDKFLYETPGNDA